MTDLADKVISTGAYAFIKPKGAGETMYQLAKQVKQLEKDQKRLIEYLNFLGIDPMDGSPEAEVIVAMRIQELQRENKTTKELLKISLDSFEELGLTWTPEYSGISYFLQQDKGEG